MKFKGISNSDIFWLREAGSWESSEGFSNSKDLFKFIVEVNIKIIFVRPKTLINMLSFKGKLFEN